ncbi:MAG: hypothetical protein QM831_12430 [Kofleriaceae bacterium]
MKPIKLIVLAVLLAIPGLASAQGYYGGGGGGGYAEPGGFHHRVGRLAWGFSVGLGGMHDDGSGITNCDNCGNAAVLEVDGHIGGVIAPRLAILFEVQANARTVHSDAYGDDTVLTQSAAMAAVQYWLLPQLWIKGGLGVAGLQADNSYVTYDYGTGLALMASAGVELLSARWFAVDLQARIIDGAYNSGSDHVTSGTIGVGFNWY